MDRSGPASRGAWLEAGLVDEWILYVAPIALGAHARPLVTIGEPASLAAARRFGFHDVRRCGDDLRLMLRPEPVHAVLPEPAHAVRPEPRPTTGDAAPRS